jgi:hypothetical protein
MQYLRRTGPFIELNSPGLFLPGCLICGVLSSLLGRLLRDDRLPLHRVDAPAVLTEGGKKSGAGEPALPRGGQVAQVPPPDRQAKGTRGEPLVSYSPSVVQSLIRRRSRR